MPRIGIAFAPQAAGYPAAPARDRGCRRSHRVRSGDSHPGGRPVELNNEGTVCFLFNPDAYRIEFYNAGTLKFAIRM
ncbi:MAG: hypothetical protein ACM3NZ_07030 [Betaproteobacteria bacterium]